MAKNSWQQERARRAREQERFVAQQQRDVSRQERETKRAQEQADRERRALYLSERQAEADERTAATQRRIGALETILSDGVRRPVAIDFAAMRMRTSVAPFDPGTLGQSAREPRWEDFAPAEPGLVSRLFGGDARHGRVTQEARLRFEQTLSAYHKQEEHRAAELERSRQRHGRQEADRQEHANKHNAHITALQEAFQAGQQEAVEQCLRLALGSRAAPDAIPRDVEIGYRADSRQVLLLRDLPDTDVIPTPAHANPPSCDSGTPI